MKLLVPSLFASSLVLPLGLASGCSSTPADGGSGNVAGSATSAGSGNVAGSATSAGSGAVQGGSAASGGSTAAGASTAGGSGNAGTSNGGGGDANVTGGSTAGGSTAGGSGGSGGEMAGGGSGGGFEEGDTLPWRPLNVIAAVGEHIHGNAGVDTRAQSLGKLVVDIGVNSGGYVSWLAKRGYHSIGAPCGSCPAPNLGAGRDAVGQCRLMEFEHTKTSVLKTLTDLAGQYPEEDWGYFLNQDGSVRWSDVAITGMSHGATTAEIAGRLGERMWRVVSRSGPRDNTCGQNGGVCSVPLTTPSYDTNCDTSKIASWLDQPSKTPMSRFYALVGTTDVECGDIMFNLHHTQFLGEPVLWNMQGAVLTGTNQFFSTDGGHLDFLNAANKPLNTEAVLDIAFGIPPENQNPNF